MSNDLPLKNGSLKKILSFSNNTYVFFNETKEAQDFINYIREQAIENNDRYENSFNGATEKLLKIIDSFIITGE